MRAGYTGVYEHLISDVLEYVVPLYHCQLPEFPLTNDAAAPFLYLFVFTPSCFSTYLNISAALFHFSVLSTALLPE